MVRLVPVPPGAGSLWRFEQSPMLSHPAPPKRTGGGRGGGTIADSTPSVFSCGQTYRSDVQPHWSKTRLEFHTGSHHGDADGIWSFIIIISSSSCSEVAECGQRLFWHSDDRDLLGSGPANFSEQTSVVIIAREMFRESNTIHGMPAEVPSRLKIIVIGISLRLFRVCYENLAINAQIGSDKGRGTRILIILK